MIAEHAVQPVITVDGRPLPAELKPFVEQVVVDDHLELPDAFEVCLLDPQHDMLAQAGLRVGARVEISGNARGSQEGQPLIHGEVTALEADYGVRGARVLVQGFDMSHRLQRGTRTDVYRNETDSGIVRKVAQRAGLELGEIESTSQTHEQVAQPNLSDWDFLKARAQAIGYELTVLEGKLHFRSRRRSADAPTEGNLLSSTARQLVFGDGLLEYHQRVSAAAQVSEVEVRGWDAEQKQAVSATASAGTTAAESDAASPASLAQLFGGRRLVSVAEPYARSAQAEEAAGAIAEAIGSSFAEADGTCRGDPQLRAGTAVSVAGVGAAFDGRYVLTHTRHVFDGDGYRTHFSISGRHNRSLLALVARPSASNGTTATQAGSTTVAGLVRGIVTDNNDPQELGRVKVKMPALDDNLESSWAPVTQLGAGPDSGAVFLPEVNDEVLVGFEHGRFDYPVVVGSLYNGRDKPRLGDGLLDNGKVRRRGFVSRKGHRFVFFDDDQDAGIALLTSDGDIRLALKETGQELHLYCGGKVIVEAGQDMTLKSGTGLTIEAGTQLTLKGSSGVKLQSDGIVDVDGSLIQLN